jgi:hypothetical protein
MTAEASVPGPVTEKEFSDLVDCRFPYQEPERWKVLIDIARGISTNAMFIALHEICRPPRGTNVTREQQREMLAYWQAHCDHPLADSMAHCARTMIEGRFVPVGQAVEIIAAVSANIGQYAALSIAYFSCDDVQGEVETCYQEVVASWNATLS